MQILWFERNRGRKRQSINHYYGDRNEKQNLQGIFNHIDRNVYSARLPKSSSGVDSYLKAQDKIMDQMMKDMELKEKTGSSSLAFLTGMIPHHESAIEMSEEYLKYAPEDAHFRKLAEDIIMAQTSEIEQMKNMMEDIKSGYQTDGTKEEAYLKEYDEMMEGHHSGHGSSDTQDLDTAFAEGMVMHHQMAVDMAETIIKYSDNDSVTDYANSVIELQGQEISQMQDFLDGKNGSGNTHWH